MKKIYSISLTLYTGHPIFIQKNKHIKIYTMERIIQNVEKWRGYIPEKDNEDNKTMFVHRITTTDGEQFITWRWEDDPELESYKNYEMKETGVKLFSFHNEDKREYTSVRVMGQIPMQTKKKVITDTPTLFDQESPVETMQQPVRVVERVSEVEYHKLAMDMLWKMEELNLPNLALLAPLMKDICEGNISKDKLGKLHLELYGKMV